jgi:enoyl-CoA hydratase/carnithine racemase
MGKPMVDYVELPKFDEYKEWFKDHFDLMREEGILQVTMKTGDHPMHWSGGAHRAMSQLSRIISMDHENEIMIWTHKGPDWMKDSDVNGWERYAKERFEHQYYDDTNLIKNMIFDLEIPTIGAIQGPGFHWDSAILCDITIASEDCKFDDPHLQYGLVPGDGMALLMQHFLGTKRANYLMYTSRQWDAKQALEWGWISEIAPKGNVLERAWELARLIKTVPYETRCITSYLCKRPLERMIVNDLKLHTVSEQYSTMIKIAQGDLGEHGRGQMDEAYHGLYARWRYDGKVNDMMEPQTAKSWDIHQRAVDWDKKNPKK